MRFSVGHRAYIHMIQALSLDTLRLGETTTKTGGNRHASKQSRVLGDLIRNMFRAQSRKDLEPLGT